LDGDTKNSTYSDKFKAGYPDRFVECFIAEQNLVGVGAGLAARGKIVFLSTFACFLTRAFDQIRMAGISKSPINLAGSHVGVSIGADGPSQMGLEDIAMFRTIPGCIVFYPSDAVSTEKAVELAANHNGMTFIRTGRPANAVLYDNNESFAIGHGKVIKHRTDDLITVVAAGVTLHETIAAAEILSRDGVAIRILDPFTVKPLDRKLILENAKQTHGRVLVVEDHYLEGGLGDAVAGELADEPGVVVYKMGISEIPHSGEPEELLERYGISASHIAQKVKKIISLRRRDTSAEPLLAEEPPVESVLGE
jgi:transketolase